MERAYSYIRFSTGEQRKGDSLRRQLEATRRWCEDNGVGLDESLTFKDLGKSAFLGKHRENADRNALAAFLKMVEDGRVPRGSFLVVESLDRLTREDIQPALLLILHLLQDGVRVVQLSPARLVYDDKSEAHAIMLMIVELMRGHGESKRKSDLLGPAWREKKRRAAAGLDQKETKYTAKGCQVMTRRLPSWVKSEGGRLALIPEKAETVRLIFRLSRAGYGYSRIVAKLIKDGVPPLAGAQWERSYVAKILRDGRAAGLYTPKGRGRKPEGDPVPYFPACVSVEEWQDARAERRHRQRAVRGWMSAPVNIFARLVRCALDGSAYYLTSRTGGGRKWYVLSNIDSAEGRGRCRSFPYFALESAVLALLREVDPADVCGTGDRPDPVRILAGKVEQVEASLARLTADMDEHGETPTLMARSRVKDAELTKLRKELADAQAEARHPLSADWGTLQSLAALLAQSPDPADTRLRLRTVLRHTVEDMRLLVVGRGMTRLAAVQLFFKSDGNRSYLIRYQPAQGNGRKRSEPHWHARSLKDALPPGPGDLDLRQKKHAARLERLLAEVDIAALASAMR